jgi:ABC-type transport system involved in multi-copper enzyme maturation permease subunit
VNAIYAIAINTVRQTVRQRLFYNVVLFGLGLVLLAMVVSNITFGFPDRVVRSIGLSGVSIASCLMALLVGVSLVHQEIESKTLFVLLTRPLARWQYVSGRFLGLLIAIVAMTVALSVVFLVVLSMVGGSVSGNDLVALGMVVPEAAVLGAIGVAISCFSTPTLGTGIALGVWIIGASSDDLVRLTAGQDGVNHLAKVVWYVFPAMARFDFREAVVYQLELTPSEPLWALAYGFTYTLAVVSLASLVIARREMV